MKASWNDECLRIPRKTWWKPAVFLVEWQSLKASTKGNIKYIDIQSCKANPFCRKAHFNQIVEENILTTKVTNKWNRVHRETAKRLLNFTSVPTQTSSDHPIPHWKRAQCSQPITWLAFTALLHMHNTYKAQICFQCSIPKRISLKSLCTQSVVLVFQSYFPPLIALRLLDWSFQRLKFIIHLKNTASVPLWDLPQWLGQL